MEGEWNIPRACLSKLHGSLRALRGVPIRWSPRSFSGCELPDVLPSGIDEEWTLPEEEVPNPTSAWSPKTCADYLAPRLGLEMDRRGESPIREAPTVALAVVEGDAYSATPYAAVKSIQGPLPPFETVIIDPPFGLDKHQKPMESWDAPRKKWGPAHLRFVVEQVKEKELMYPGRFSVAMYCLVQDVGTLVTAMEDFDDFKGFVLYGFEKEHYAFLRKGIATPGLQQYLVVFKFGNGQVVPQADGDGMGGRTQFTFPSVGKRSKFGRAEIDAQLWDAVVNAPVNTTQKAVEESRLLVRHLTPECGRVLSICNGTGSVLVAAALEGRSAVGVDSSHYQNSWAVRRLQTLLHREILLYTALVGETKESKEKAVADLRAAVAVESVQDLQVRFGGEQKM